MVVTVSFFDDASVPEFRDYRRIKHVVFVREQGWDLPSDHDAELAHPDPFDPHSMFVVARAEGRSIGIARATMIRDAFPHADFFEGQMVRPELQAVHDVLATVNAVAVLPEFRGRKVRIEGRGQSMTTGKALMVELTKRLDQAGAAVTVLTTSPGVAAIFFDHLGYYLIDAPFPCGARTLINMGLCIHDEDHFRAIGSPIADLALTSVASDAERQCVAYFRERSATILRGKRMEEFVSSQLASAAKT
jgi:GNAT superfamily N-acetyltransferase